MPLPDTLKANGFRRIPADDPASIDTMVTWQLGEAKVVLRGERLERDGSRVFRFMAEGKELTMHKLYVPSSLRREGHASRLIEKLLASVDAEGFVLYLEPLPYEKPASVSKEALIALYARHGFVAADETSKVLIRRPQTAS